MRILSWNINGVRTLPQYHPWNTLKSCQAILEHLEADIICFQEMKTTRTGLDYDWAVPDAFDGFFSFPITKGGYSGVAVYTRTQTAAAIKAEEGLTGTLQPKTPLKSEERVSSKYPSAGEMELVASENGDIPSELTHLDAEGRALVLDFGLFVLINVYCPNLTSEARTPFKMNFLYLLEERVRTLIQEGREVVVVGDINICSSPLDHAEGYLPSYASTWFDNRPDRVWLRNLLNAESGLMCDVMRKFWPERKGMFTCWNTRISARDSNYGARIDYILVTRGILPWIKHGDIQASLKGSDHCPIYVDLYDEITLDSGETLTIREAMRQDDTAKDSPRIAAKFWDEFTGKQTSLDTFFGKGAKTPTILLPGGSLPSLTETGPLVSSSITDNSQQTSPVRSAPTGLSDATSETLKRRALPSNFSSAKTKRKKAEQAKLSTFFSKPSTTEAQSSSQTMLSQLEEDYNLATRLSSDEVGLTIKSQQGGDNGKAVWGQLFARTQPPKCHVHNEPAKELTVTKAGPNKGKNFFICSRPVGPGYDRGRSERRRDEVNHTYKCDFFKWSSEVRKETMRDKTE